MMKEGGNYIVTEGKVEATLIKKLLPQEALDKVKVLNGRGHSSALSMAVTLLVKKENFVVLIADSDTMNYSGFQNKYNFIRDYLKMAAPEDFFKIYLFKPEFETIFLESKEVLETLAGQQIGNREVSLAKGRAKDYLYDLLNLNRKQFEDFVEKLPATVVRKLQKTKFAKDLTQYIMGLN